MMENDRERQPEIRNRKGFKAVQICMRMLVIGAALASTWIMVTSKEIASVYGFSFAAKYSYSSTFRFFAYANAAICGVTLLSLLYACLAGRSSNHVFALFLCDLCLTLVAISASSAATAEGSLGKNGNQHTGWQPICQYVHHYCDRVTLSVALSFASSLLLLVLTVLSAAAARQL